MEGLEHIVALADEELTETLTRIARAERKAIALLVATLAEFDARRLYLGLGYNSLFEYCTRALFLSEQAAYTRIEAARASRRFPIIITRIEEGRLSLTATRLLAPHLTDDNHVTLLDRASRQKTKAVEVIVATIRPREPVSPTIRRLPAAPTAPPATDVSQAESSAPAGDAAPTPQPRAHRPVLHPLSEAHYRLQITISAGAHDKLRQAQALMRHSVPNGDPAAIVERALDVLLLQLRKTKFAETSRPRASGPSGATLGADADMRTGGDGARGRHIPASVKRAVAKRDGDRCAFVGRNGLRCGERGFLEYHHVKPFAKGGPATTGNIELRCRAHNAYEGELVFGPR